MRPPYFDKDTMTYHQPLDTPQDIAADVMHTFTADRDGKIRARLIELGWMPPEVTKVARRAADAHSAGYNVGEPFDSEAALSAMDGLVAALDKLSETERG